MRIHGDMLFVVDSIYGVYCVNTTTTELQMLVGVDDANLKYPNDIEVNSDGTAVYFSDCSQRWAAYQILYLYFEGTHYFGFGLLHFSKGTSTFSALLWKLFFFFLRVKTYRN